MANVVEIIVKARDTASPVLASIGKAFAGLGIIAAGAIGIGMIAPLAAGALALGSFAAVAIPSLMKVQKALTTTGTAGATAFAALSQPQKDLFHDVRTLQGAFDQLQKAMAPVVAQVADLAVKVGMALLPMIKGLAGAGATVLTDFFRPLLRMLQSDFFAGFIRQMSRLATDIAPAVGKALVGLLHAFFLLFEQVGPQGADLLSRLLAILVKFVNSLIPFITWVVKAADAVARWVDANRVLAGSLLLVGAAVAIATGGLSVIIPAILIVIAYLTYLWKHSETFRNVVTTAFADVANAVLRAAGMILDSLHTIASGFLNMIKPILEVAAAIPGPWHNAAKSLLANFNNMQAGMDNWFAHAKNTLDGWRAAVTNMPHIVKLQGDITDLQAKITTAKHILADKSLTATYRSRVQSDISQALAQIAAIKAQLAILNGMTVNTYVQTIYLPGQGGPKATGGITGAAGGGGRSGMTLVGEHGAELVSLPPGSMVHSNPDTQRMLSQGGGGVDITVSVDPRMAPGLSRELLKWLKFQVRTTGGGDVQAAFGSG